MTQVRQRGTLLSLASIIVDLSGIIPAGSGLVEPQWNAICPVGRGPDPYMGRP